MWSSVPLDLYLAGSFSDCRSLVELASDLMLTGREEIDGRPFTSFRRYYFLS